jgi:hypothetical protein
MMASSARSVRYCPGVRNDRSKKAVARVCDLHPCGGSRVDANRGPPRALRAGRDRMTEQSAPGDSVVGSKVRRR